MTLSELESTLAPLGELAALEEFTNRKQELEFLWGLAEKAQRRAASSYCLIARKGMGKTALMLEFYRQLFTRQREVVPFYVSFAEHRYKPGMVQLSLEDFISKLFVTFAFQYGIFKSGKFSLPPELPVVPSQQKQFFASCGDAFLGKNYVDHIEAMESGAMNEAFDQAIRFASYITSLRGEAGIVMIDEFQVLTQVYDQRYQKFRNITEWFQKPAEARHCPMVISGSAVSLVVETVMGGLLARRFGPYYLEPFDQEYSLEFIYKLSRKEQVRLSEEAALEIHRLTGGNPYYIWCFFGSLGLQDRDLSTTERVEQVYTFETTALSGKMRQFWNTHFKAVADKINDDKIGLQALYHLAVAKQEVRVEEIAAELNVPPERVRRVMRNLEDADLVGPLTASLYPIYERIKDPILAAYVAREYQTGLAGQSLDTFLQSQLAELRKLMGSAARMLGEAAELYTRHLLMNFDGQEVESAEVFNLDGGPLRLPKFKKVEHRTGFIISGEAVEFDLLAEGEENWIVEVKYRKTPVRLKEVEEFVEKLHHLVGMENWQVALPPGKRLWFFSRSGFDHEADARLRKLGILHSDILQFNALCRAVKIGEVPV